MSHRGQVVIVCVCVCLCVKNVLCSAVHLQYFSKMAQFILNGNAKTSRIRNMCFKSPLLLQKAPLNDLEVKNLVCSE